MIPSWLGIHTVQFRRKGQIEDVIVLRLHKYTSCLALSWKKYDPETADAQKVTLDAFIFF